MRLKGLAVVALVLVVSACGGGGGSSPTEPTPPVPLEGDWSGSVTITSPNSATCTMALNLVRDGVDYLGNWEAQCSGAQGSGFVFVTSVFGNQVLLSGFRSQSVFGGCSWVTTAIRDGNRLRGDDWSTTQNCSTGPVLRGRVELTKR